MKFIDIHKECWKGIFFIRKIYKLLQNLLKIILSIDKHNKVNKWMEKARQMFN